MVTREKKGSKLGKSDQGQEQDRDQDVLNNVSSLPTGSSQPPIIFPWMILRFDFDPCSTAWDVSFTFTELFCARRWQQYFTQHFNTSDANCIELTSTKKTLNILAKRGRVSCQSVVPWSRIQSHKSLWFGIKTLVSWKVWLFQLAWELDFDISWDQLWPILSLRVGLVWSQGFGLVHTLWEIGAVQSELWDDANNELSLKGISYTRHKWRKCHFARLRLMPKLLNFLYVYICLISILSILWPDIYE